MPPALVQSKTGQVSGATSLAVTFTSPLSIGNAIIVAVAHTSSIPTITDDDPGGSNSYLGNSNEPGTGIAAFSSIAVNVPSNRAYKVTATGVSQNFALCIMEWSGMGTAGPDPSAGTGASGSGANPSSGNFTTATANEVLIGILAVNTSAASGISDEAGWTNVCSLVGLPPVMDVQYKVVAASTNAATWTWANMGVNNWAAGIFAYEPSGFVPPQDGADIMAARHMICQP